MSLGQCKETWSKMMSSSSEGQGPGQPGVEEEFMVMLCLRCGQLALAGLR